MMKIFTQHPYEQGITYSEHLIFAMNIAWRLFRSVLAFAMHGVLPCIGIEKELDLEATSAFLLGRNDYIETAAEAGKQNVAGIVLTGSPQVDPLVRH